MPPAWSATWQMGAGGLPAGDVAEARLRGCRAVRERGEVAAEVLDPAAMRAVTHALLDRSEQRRRVSQRRDVPARAVVLAQAIDGECLPIEPLLRVERQAAAIEAPETTAVIAVQH